MKTKTITLLPLVLTIVLSLSFAVPAFATNSSTGNGAPSGKHYTLNLLGKNWNKGNYALITDPSDQNYNPVVKNDNGHRIFVKLNGKTRILLMEDTVAPYDFNVLDADGTDGKAIFQLPNPQAVIIENELISTAYQVYIRMLGKPTGQADMYSGFFDPVTGDTWVSAEIITLRQNDPTATITRKSPPKFEDVAKELLTIWYDSDGDGNADTRVGLFDDSMYQYFWDYDNTGLRHVQLRFYPVSAV